MARSLVLVLRTIDPAYRYSNLRPSVRSTGLHDTHSRQRAHDVVRTMYVRARVLGLVYKFSFGAVVIGTFKTSSDIHCFGG
jgi:hypothetical protein